MDPPSYSNAIDVECDLLTSRLTGLWDMAVLAAHCADFDRTVALCAGRPYRVLADLRDFAVQSQQVNAGLQAFVAARVSVRTAILLSGSILQRMQSQRVLARDTTVRNFDADEEAAARLWLLEVETVASRVARA